MRGAETDDLKMTLERLRRRAPFDRIEDADRRWLAERLRPAQYADGTVLLTAGSTPDRLYFLTDGEVELHAMGESLSGDRVLARLVAGESFPLEALNDRRPVFSNFRVQGAATALELGIDDFEALKKRSRHFREYCRQRAATFLDQSRRWMHTHFSNKGGEGSALNTPISKMLRAHPLTCAPETTLREALERMADPVSHSIVVTNSEDLPLGIFTLEDLLKRVALAGTPLETPVAQVMSRDPVSIEPSAYGFEAALLMARHAFRQLLVVEEGRLVGVVSERDLFSVQRVGVAQISGAIQRATAVEALRAATDDIRQLAHNLLTQGVAAEQLTRIISTLNDHLTRRVIELELEGEDLADVRFAWIALGSEGRYEQTLSTDQDNGIVFDCADPSAADAIRARLLPAAQRINRTLADCGFPLCKGDVMAGNPRWCLSLEEWQRAFSRWLHQPEPEALLNAAIFFDLRHLYGDDRLTGALKQWLIGAAPAAARFLLLATRNALQRTPPLGFFRDFIVESGPKHRGTLSLKLSGVSLFVDAARIYGLAHRVADSNTVTRLRQGAVRAGVGEDEVQAWIDAFGFIQMLRLRKQYEQYRDGQEPDNRIRPEQLNPLDRRFLLEALRQAGRLQKRLELDFAQAAPGG